MGGSLILEFKPWHGLLGGLAMGLAAGAKLLMSGRVLGISGALKGLLKGDFSMWRLCFLGGMAVGSLSLPGMLPDAFDKIPATYTIGRAAIGALMVGLGSAIGNGCTSGHGICGNARLSVRSMAYTCTFMASGILMATLAGTTAALGISNVAATYTAPTADSLALSYKVLGATATSLSAAAALGFAGRKLGLNKTKVGANMCDVVNGFVEAVAGVTFAVALGLSGMVRPTKVAGFLSMLAPSRDFSLMFVMGGALLVATPLIQWALYRNGRGEPPFCAKKYELPASKAVDQTLLTGGVLFGAGWGICGACPGPILVNLVVDPTVINVTLGAALMAGMILADKVVLPRLNSGGCKLTEKVK